MITVTAAEVSSLPNQTDVTLTGTLSGVEASRTAHGGTECRAVLTDSSGRVDLYFTPVVYGEVAELLTRSGRREVSGFVDWFDGQVSVFVMRVREAP